MCSVIKECLYLNTLRGRTYVEIYGRSNLEAPTAAHNHTSNIVLLIHGLGGSTEHWDMSSIGPFLAKSGKVAISFDWYSHGKSTRIKSRKVPHTVEFFTQQLHELINSEFLPMKGNRFCIHAFSMGCYLTINYLISDAGTSTVKVLDKLVLQSPWNGRISPVSRVLLRLPLTLRAFKATVDFHGMKSVKTLKHIILDLGSYRKFEDMLPELRKKVFESTALDVVDEVTYRNYLEACDAATGAEDTSIQGAGTHMSLKSIGPPPRRHPVTLLLIAGALEPEFISNTEKVYEAIGSARSVMTVCPSAAHTSFTRRDHIAKFYHEALMRFYESVEITAEMETFMRNAVVRAPKAEGAAAAARNSSGAAPGDGSEARKATDASSAPLLAISITAANSEGSSVDSNCSGSGVLHHRTATPDSPHHAPDSATAETGTDTGTGTRAGSVTPPPVTPSRVDHNTLLS